MHKIDTGSKVLEAPLLRAPIADPSQQGHNLARLPQLDLAILRKTWTDSFAVFAGFVSRNPAGSHRSLLGSP